MLRSLGRRHVLVKYHGSSSHHTVSKHRSHARRKRGTRTRNTRTGIKTNVGGKLHGIRAEARSTKHETRDTGHGTRAWSRSRDAEIRGLRARATTRPRATTAGQGLRNSKGRPPREHVPTCFESLGPPRRAPADCLRFRAFLVPAKRKERNLQDNITRVSTPRSFSGKSGRVFPRSTAAGVRDGLSGNLFSRKFICDL